MVDREVNPVEARHMKLSARFKAAWAFHQLLVGMERMGAATHFENKSDLFQALYSRLRDLAEALHAPITTGEELNPSLIQLDLEIEDLIRRLDEFDRKIAPSNLRQFFQQIRTLDERILIEIVRFYIEVQKGKSWEADRLDKADYLLSRLADLVAGPDLKGDRTRLGKVLRGISDSADMEPLDEAELQHLTVALQDQQSEVRWIKSFEELNESGRIELYRALKHELAGKMFSTSLLPLVVDVNSSFRVKIDELRKQAESRIVDEFQRLSQLQQGNQQIQGDVSEELDRLHDRVEEFRSRVKESNIRLSELVDLSRSLDDIGERYEARFQPSVRSDSAPDPGTQIETDSSVEAFRSAFSVEIEVLQPFWNELVGALTGLNGALSASEVTADGSVLDYRLESSEVEAFRRLLDDNNDSTGTEKFILAGAVLRRQILHHVAEIRRLLGEDAVHISQPILLEARQTTRIADAYVKHFSHLIDQSVFDGLAADSRTYQILRNRLQRDLSGLMILVLRLHE